MPNDTITNTKQKLTSGSVLPIGDALKESTRLMASASSPAKSDKEKDQPKNLSMNVAEHLLSLMKKVTEKEVNPSTVNAACNCANQMINLMKVNVQIGKIP